MFLLVCIVFIVLIYTRLITVQFTRLTQTIIEMLDDFENLPSIEHAGAILGQPQALPQREL